MATEGVCSKRYKNCGSNPNSIKALKENRFDRTGLRPWNKGLKINYKARKYNFSQKNIKSMINKKMTLKEISKIYNCSVGALYNFMNKKEIKANNNYLQHQKESVKQKMREKRLKQKFNNKETSIEIKTEKILKSLKIPYIKQKNIMNITLVDFFIKPNICIYCDGDYWHNLDYVKKRDKRINKELKKNYYKVYRFTEYSINKDADSIKEQLHKFKEVRP